MHVTSWFPAAAIARNACRATRENEVAAADPILSLVRPPEVSNWPRPPRITRCRQHYSTNTRTPFLLVKQFEQTGTPLLPLWLQLVRDGRATVALAPCSFPFSSAQPTGFTQQTLFASGSNVQLRTMVPRPRKLGIASLALTAATVAFGAPADNTIEVVGDSGVRCVRLSPPLGACRTFRIGHLCSLDGLRLGREGSDSSEAKIEARVPRSGSTRLGHAHLPETPGAVIQRAFLVDSDSNTPATDQSY